MAKAIALVQTATLPLDWLRTAVVCTCALALIAAGDALPSLGL